MTCGVATLAAIAKRLGRQALEHLALVAKPETMGWYRKLTLAARTDLSSFSKTPKWFQPSP
jgi:hypothetical protein